MLDVHVSTEPSTPGFATDDVLRLRPWLVRSAQLRVLRWPCEGQDYSKPATARVPRDSRSRKFEESNPARLALKYHQSVDAANQSQCYVRLPIPDLAGGRWRLPDQIGTAT